MLISFKFFDKCHIVLAYSVSNVKNVENTVKRYTGVILRYSGNDVFRHVRRELPSGMLVGNREFVFSLPVLLSSRTEAGF